MSTSQPTNRPATLKRLSKRKSFTVCTHTSSTHVVPFRYKKLWPRLPKAHQTPPPAKKRRLYSEEEYSILKRYFDIGGERSKVAKLSECADFLREYQRDMQFEGKDTGQDQKHDKAEQVTANQQFFLFKM